MKFNEVQIDALFSYNGEQFKKIKPEKVTCCRTNNALKISNNEKVMIKKNPDVEIVSEQQ